MTKEIHSGSIGPWARLNGLPRFRRVPGAGAGVVAMSTLRAHYEGKKCRVCGRAFQEDDVIWFCDRVWLGTRSHGCWCFACLKEERHALSSAPPDTDTAGKG